MASACSAPTGTTSRRSSADKQLALQRKRDIADLVQEQGAAGGGAEEADAVCFGVGEGTAAMAEQLAFEQLRR